MNSYDLSRKWFDWCFENPEKINTNHTALYFFCIEHCNRLGWKKKFGLPTTMAKEAIGIKSYNTYINTLKDLINFGFIELIEKSKNQYSCNIIAISNFNKATTKALDKALIKHVTKQGESICSIDKQETNKQETKFDFYSDFDKCDLKPEQIETFKNICSEFEKSHLRVQQLEHPLTAFQLYKLIKTHSKEKTLTILDNMENYKPLLKKSVSAYDTVNAWIRREAK